MENIENDNTTEKRWDEFFEILYNYYINNKKKEE